ncbi:hypothetical protein CCACVL1_07145 [Corchorus capsularis]|uniref:Uncharacterized protein n=1 Tax=Corchorus capsularis TaxID=210143 RepID=A0A1R3J989_COCAP|nr:hypothetical protein CCACVL1_07145 [Corchorus capsularis]
MSPSNLPPLKQLKLPEDPVHFAKTSSLT